jgi:dihydroorotate dehydrogenase
MHVHAQPARDEVHVKRLAQSGYEHLTRPLIFRTAGGDAEQAHQRTLDLLGLLGRIPPARALLTMLLTGHRQPATVAGIDFPGMVGLAAGMDKDGVAVRAWPMLGFGFVELGTVTPQPQRGNPRPRLYRLPASQAFINRMGFNNDGADALAARLSREVGLRGDRRRRIPIGISIGKNKDTRNAEAIADYRYCFDRLRDYADYIAVNVSSPNTPGLRSLQDREHLTELLDALVSISRADPDARPAPIFVKVSPDLTEDALEELLDVCQHCGVDGLIAVNTTTGRDGLRYADLKLAPQAGGLSGRPLNRRARQVIGFLAARSRLPVIGVGGVTTIDDAQALLDAGASLLQVYTGFIYHGPAFIDRINKMSRQRGRSA